MVTNDNIYLSFNYTNTLEKLYGVRKNNICYIHGDASINNQLIFGHRNDSYYPEWDGNSEDVDIRLLEAGTIMENFRINTKNPLRILLLKIKNFLILFTILNAFISLDYPITILIFHILKK